MSKQKSRDRSILELGQKKLPGCRMQPRFAPFVSIVRSNVVFNCHALSEGHQLMICSLYFRLGFDLMKQVREFTAGAGSPCPERPLAAMTVEEVNFLGKMILDEVRLPLAHPTICFPNLKQNVSVGR